MIRSLTAQPNDSNSSNSRKEVAAAWCDGKTCGFCLTVDFLDCQTGSHKGDVVENAEDVPTLQEVYVVTSENSALSHFI
jgi:hypothetical protein